MSSSLRIAVTGGSGKIGRALIKELVERGHSVINIDRRASPDRLARFVFADLRKREQIQPVFDQVDAAVHLAEIPTSHGPHSPEHIFSHNIQAASVVMQTAADLQLKRFIYTSSCQVYGCYDHVCVPPLRLPFDETHPAQPQNVYALGKVAAESYARWLAKESKLSMAIFRFPWVLTGEMNEHYWRWIEHKQKDPEGMGTYIHATDAAHAYALALEDPRPGCEAYHFTASEIWSLVPLRELVAGQEHPYPALPEGWPAFKSPVITDKARQHFGWEPKWNMLDFWRKRTGKEPGTEAA